MIEGCSFGRMVIDGQTHTADLVIYPDGRVEGPWYRKSGHRLSKDDINELMESRPDVIIAGTGVNGLVRPDKGLGEFLSGKGIRFISAPNQEAMEVYNELSSRLRVGACFHLTC
jgi:hypothetical protein